MCPKFRSERRVLSICIILALCDLLQESPGSRGDLHGEGVSLVSIGLHVVQADVGVRKKSFIDNWQRRALGLFCGSGVVKLCQGVSNQGG